MSDKSQIRDAVETALAMARDLANGGVGIVGYGVIELRHEDGSLGLVRPFANLVTDVGDLYYATMGIALVTPSNTAQPTKLTGMQIGSNAAAVTKASTGAGMNTFLFGKAFDATYPKAVALASGQGAEAQYMTTFAAGEGTSTTVNEAVLTNGTIGTTSAVANTIARILTGTINKGAGDSLAITWRNKFLGA